MTIFRANEVTRFSFSAVQIVPIFWFKVSNSFTISIFGSKREYETVASLNHRELNIQMNCNNMTEIYNYNKYFTGKQKLIFDFCNIISGYHLMSVHVLLASSTSAKQDK
jgi:hypothetical protein